MDWGEFKEEFGSNWKQRARERFLQNLLVILLVLPFVGIIAFHVIKRSPEKHHAKRLVGAALGPGIIDKRVSKKHSVRSSDKKKLAKNSNKAKGKGVAKANSKTRKIASVSDGKSRKLFKHKGYYKTQAGKLKPQDKTKAKPVSLREKDPAVASAPRLVKD